MASWLCFSLLLLHFTHFTLTQPIVTVEQGDVIGKTVYFEDDFLGMSKNIDIFAGIPYAESPAGQNRLKPPVPKGSWNGVYNATYFREICPQYNAEADGFAQSEDCLYLNIYVNNPTVSYFNFIPV